MLYKNTSPNIILLPGFDGTGNMFGRLIDALGNQAQPQIISYPTTDNLNYHELSHYVAQQLPEDDCFIVAESFAGPLALLLTEMELLQLRGLILCASFVRCPYPKLGRLGKPLVGSWMFRLPVSKQSVKFFLTNHYYDHTELTDMITAHRQLAPTILAHRLKAIIDTDVSEIFKHCTLPLMCLHAARDRLIGRSPAKLLHQLRPDIPHHLINAPHFILQTQASIASQKIMAFIHSSIK